ncbi:MAG: HEAT repeat domain-containing protein [Myxococcota bacterium]
MKSRQLFFVWASLVVGCDGADRASSSHRTPDEPAVASPAPSDFGLTLLLDAPDLALDGDRIAASAPPDQWLRVAEQHLGGDSAYLQLRAVTVLRHLESPRAVVLLESLVDAEDTPRLLRRTAVKALSARAPERALPRLQRLMADQDRTMREAVLHGLAAIPDERATSMLELRGNTEPEPGLRALADRLRSARSVPESDHLKGR